MDPSCYPILVNERAGALHNTPTPQQMQELAHEIGVNVQVIPTKSPEHMRETLRWLVREEYPRVAVVGGDGTVALAVQEVARTETALGIIPQGTFNNFAMALRLPADLPSALRVIRDGVVRPIDLGLVRDRYFTEAAGVGLFADALALYGSDTTKSLIRALRTAAHLLFSYRAYGIRLIADGNTTIERAVLCTVANTYRTGSAVPIAPEAKVTDGKLDVVIVGNLKRDELIPYFRALRETRHLSLPKVTSLRAQDIRIETRRPMRVHCDDQIVGTTPVTITAAPKALKVLVERL